MRALSGERIEDISMTFGEELISGTGHGAAHELRSLDLELLAVELDKAAIKAEKLARLSVFRAVHEIELREDDGMAFDRTWSGAVRALFGSSQSSFQDMVGSSQSSFQGTMVNARCTKGSRISTLARACPCEQNTPLLHS